MYGRGSVDTFTNNLFTQYKLLNITVILTPITRTGRDGPARRTVDVIREDD